MKPVTPVCSRGLIWAAAVWRALPTKKGHMATWHREDMVEDLIVLLPLMLRLARPHHRPTRAERMRLFEYFEMFEEHLESAIRLGVITPATAWPLLTEADKLETVLRLRD